MWTIKRRVWLGLFVAVTALTTVMASVIVGQCCLPLGSTSCVSPCQRGKYLGPWYHCYECTDGRGTEWCCWYYWERYQCEDRQPPYEPCHPPYQRELRRQTADPWYVCRVYSVGKEFCEQTKP